MPRYSPTEQAGVHAVASIVTSDLKWIFREQPIIDVGIDAQIELVEPEGEPTGRLIGVQLKTGVGNFTEKDEGYVYYGQNAHLKYWLAHSLPVILVAHIPKVGTFWQAVDESTVEQTPKGWKLLIPKSRLLGGETKGLLRKQFDGPPAQQKLRNLAINEPLMRHIKSGGKVSIALEEWVNKSLGRTPVEVFIHDEDGEEALSQEWGVMYAGFDIRRLAEVLFPWATARVDEEFYEENADEPLEDEAIAVARDADNGIFWKSLKNDIYPYAEHGGEVASYRLVLRLNRLGHSYLIVADHLAEAPVSGF